MRERDVGLLPVCDGKPHVRAMLTDRDTVTRVVAEGANLQMKVGDSASGGLVTCGEEEALSKAQELMEANKLQRLAWSTKMGNSAGSLAWRT